MSATAQEQRKYKRVKLELRLRFMLPDGQEHTGQVIDISGGGLSIASAIRPESGTTVIIYLDQLGRLEGRVVRSHESGFAVELKAPAVKREKIIESLMVLTNRIPSDPEDLRRHERVPGEGTTPLTLEDGTEAHCRILDLSISGISLETTARPPLGSNVTVGKSIGRVVRHHEHGIAVEFKNMPRLRGSLAAQLSQRTPS
ncbi:MAG: PilZ domain-containing protein [Alphaproteobacteria bacterium]|nr:PilZ domain-containing protein [Alphaproteobacteria bacterium]